VSLTKYRAVPPVFLPFSSPKSSSAAAAACGISEIAQKGERLLFVLAQVDFNKVSALCGGQTYRGRLLFSAGEKPHLALKLKKGEDPLKLATRLVEDYAAQTPPPPASTAAP